MCGGCRVTIGGKTKFVCVDGPEFDGHQVDFDNMMQRLAAYRDFEKDSLVDYQTAAASHFHPRGQGHECKVDALADDYLKKGSAGCMP